MIKQRKLAVFIPEVKVSGAEGVNTGRSVVRCLGVYARLSLEHPIYRQVSPRVTTTIVINSYSTNLRDQFTRLINSFSHWFLRYLRWPYHDLWTLLWLVRVCTKCTRIVLIKTNNMGILLLFLLLFLFYFYKIFTMWYICERSYKFKLMKILHLHRSSCKNMGKSLIQNFMIEYGNITVFNIYLKGNNPTLFPIIKNIYSF